MEITAVTTVALIVAAGRGTRAAASGFRRPNNMRALAGMTVLRRTLLAFLEHAGVERVATVIHCENQALYDAAVEGLGDRLLPCDPWRGATRAGIGAARVEGLAGGGHANSVLIHDAARPFVSAAVISTCLAECARDGGAIAALRFRYAEDEEPAKSSNARFRVTRLWRAQTPQGFNFRCDPGGSPPRRVPQCLDITDDAAVAEWSGLRVTIAQGSDATSNSPHRKTSQ